MKRIVLILLGLLILTLSLCTRSVYAATPCQSGQQTWLYTVDTSNQSHVVACLSESSGVVPWFGYINGLTSATTLTFDASLGTTQKVTLGVNVTASTLTNAITGQWMYFTICQDSSGGHTFQQPSNFVNWGAISTTANACTTEAGYYDGTDFQVISGGTGSSPGGTLGNCATALDVSGGTFCGGPPLQNTALSSTYVQSDWASTDTFSSGSASVSIGMPGPVTAGNQILVWLIDSGATSPEATWTLSDTAGNTFTQIYTTQPIAIFKATVATTGADTLNCGMTNTHGTPYAFLCVAVEASNIGSLDTYTNVAGTLFGTDNSTNTTSLTTTGTNDIVFALGYGQGSSAAPTAKLINGTLSQRLFSDYTTLNYNGFVLFGDGSTTSAGAYTYGYQSTGNYPNAFGNNLTYFFAFQPINSNWPTTGPAYFRSMQWSDLAAFNTATNNLAVDSFSATPAFDFSTTNVQTITLTANVTSSSLTGCTAGKMITFDIVEDGTGGWTFAWPSTVHGGGTITTTAGEHNRQTFYCDGTGNGDTAWATGAMQSGT